MCFQCPQYWTVKIECCDKLNENVKKDILKIWTVHKAVEIVNLLIVIG